jgi:cytochrome c-type biogenesis protein CcmH/NrfF
MKRPYNTLFCGKEKQQISSYLIFQYGMFWADKSPMLTGRYVN